MYFSLPFKAAAYKEFAFRCVYCS